MKIKEFDVFVIGSGSAGQTVAESCAKKGLKVAVSDNTVFGGTCANRGCDPKKILLGATAIWEHSNNLKGKGIETLPKLNWRKLQKFKKTFTSAVPASTESRFKDLGIAMYHQSPHFINDNTLSIEGKTVNAKTIVIASGQIPRPLDFGGSNFLKTSEDFLNLKKIPKTIAFIGAGYVGMEFAHMAARAGAKITMIDHGNRPLKAFDSDLVNHLTTASKALGIEFVFNSEVIHIEKLRKNLRITYRENGETKTQKARLVFNTSGRIPAIEELELEKGTIAHSKKGVKVNDYLQSITNPKVYACGDVSEHSLPLTPLSGYEGAIVAKNILNGNVKKVETPQVPSVVFTLPHLATVGLSEDDAKSRYKNIIVNYQSVPNWYNAKRLQEKAYAYKIIINERTDKIIGAHLLSESAAETINLFAIAINKGVTATELRQMIFTYPTFSSDIKSMV